MQKEQTSRVYGESFIVNGMMDDAIFTSFLTVFQSYQDAVRVITERLCAMDFRLRLRRFRLEAGLEPGYAISVGKLNPLS